MGKLKTSNDGFGKSGSAASGSKRGGRANSLPTATSTLQPSLKTRSSSQPRPTLRTGAGRLASARDRSRHRERELRERARVERALASVPFEVDALESVASPAREASPNRSLELVSAPVACPVCGGCDVRCDEVMQGGRLPQLRLRECERCDFRWTERGPARFADVGERMASRRVIRGVPARPGRVAL